MKEVRLVSTSGILGYGFPEESLAAGMARKPDMIGVDGGYSDLGPYCLGAGEPFAPPMAIRRDLRLMPRLVCAEDIGDTDVYGAQPHAPLPKVEIPV